MRAKRLYLSAILIGVAIIGCGGDDKDTPTTPPGTADIDQYMASLPPWEDLSPHISDKDGPTGETIGYLEDGLFCASTPWSLATTPEAIVTFGSNPGILYLGSLIQGKTYLGGLGTMEELPIRQRTPLTIALDLLSGTDITRTVENLDAASIGAAISDMASEAAASPHQLGSTLFFDYNRSYSSTQAALSLGFSFNYLGAYGRGALNFETSAEKNTVTFVCKHIMFEAYVVLPQTPSDFFSDDFTQELFDEQIALGRIGDDNLPVYVAKVQYGRMMMFSMTHTSEMSVVEAAVNVGYEGGLGGYDLEMQGKITDCLNNSKIEVVMIGGVADDAVGELMMGNLRGYFENFADPITSAKPIAYQLYNLTDNSLAYVGETTAYDRIECTQASVDTLFDLSDWQEAAHQMIFPCSTWTKQTDSAFLVKADEIDNINRTGCTDLGVELTFQSTNTGMPFTFYLKALETTCPSHDDLLFFNDPNYTSVYGNNFICIGGFSCNNDDFEIGIENELDGCFVRAIGFLLGDNADEDGEKIQVKIGENWHDFTSHTLGCPDGYQFVGIIATSPITALRFDEHPGSNGIVIKDFHFGVAYPLGK